MEELHDIDLVKCLKDSLSNDELSISKRAALDVWASRESKLPSLDTIARRAAPGVYVEFIEGNLLGGIFNNQLAMRFIANISHLESLIELTRAEISGKFYRDHLNHMIRTFLLSSYISKGLQGTNFNHIRCLAFAGLFHDIAYPIEEAQHLFRTVKEIINNSFSAFKVITKLEDIEKVIKPLTSQELKCFLNFSLNFDIHKVGLDRQMTRTILRDSFKKRKHGICSAIETRRMLKGKSLNQDWIKRTLLAIALHDAQGYPPEVKFDSFPELFLLILADELQDWNRRTFTYGTWQALINNIKVSIKKDKGDKHELSFEIDYSAPGRPSEIEPSRALTTFLNPPFSPLLQTKSKFQSLKRLGIEDCSITIRFILPRYICVARYDPDLLNEDEYKKRFSGHYVAIYTNTLNDASPGEELLELSSCDRRLSQPPNKFEEVQFQFISGKWRQGLGGTSFQLPYDTQWEVTNGFREVMLRSSEILGYDFEQLTQREFDILLGPRFYHIAGLGFTPSEIKTILMLLYGAKFYYGISLLYSFYPEEELTTNRSEKHLFEIIKYLKSEERKGSIAPDEAANILFNVAVDRDALPFWGMVNIIPFKKFDLSDVVKEIKQGREERK